MSQYMEEQLLKEITDIGYYKMANFPLAQEYVKFLKEKGLDVHVVNGVGREGVQNIIFIREKSDYIFEMLETQRANLSGKLFNVEVALSAVHDLCVG